MPLRSLVRGEHLDSGRMLSQCHERAMRQLFEWAEGLERLIVDAETSSAGSAWAIGHAAPVTRGSERRTLRTARAREAARREEKGVNVAHATLLESQGEWVEREVENSRSTGLLLGKGNVIFPIRIVNFEYVVSGTRTEM